MALMTPWRRRDDSSESPNSHVVEKTGRPAASMSTGMTGWDGERV
jgi:hypothetical protein